MNIPIGPRYQRLRLPSPCASTLLLQFNFILSCLLVSFFLSVQGGVVAILAVVIVFYVFLVSIIICVTCGKKCAKDAQKKKDAEAGAAGAAKDGKAKEEGAFEKGFGKAWNSTLQFFKLQGLAKDEDEEAAAAAAAVVVADGAKAGKIPEEKQSLVAAAKGE